MVSALKLAVSFTLLGIFLYYARIYFNGGVCYSKARMAGKRIIVTGANTGIGKETVVDLLNRGATVYMACRSLTRAEAAAGDIKQRTGVTKDRLVVMQLDLSSYKSIRNFVAEYKKREQHLDVLINNAGVMMIPEKQLTEDGNEMQVGTNHLGHFLLTNLLLDTLIASAPSRIVTVSSLGHWFHGPMDLDNLNSEKDYNGGYAYTRSKLANVMFSRELGKRLQGTGVTTYSLHPGSILTELQRHIPYIDNPIMQYTLLPVLGFFWKTVPQGAQTSICCAVDEDLAKVTGKYYSDCVETPPLVDAEDDKACKELWDMSVKLTKLKKEEMVKQVL